jgi:hypothetical protein
LAHPYQFSCLNEEDMTFKSWLFTWKNISPNTLCFLNTQKLHPMNEQSNAKKMNDSYFICKMDQVQNYSISFVLSYSHGLCDLNLIFKNGLLHLWSWGKMGLEKLKIFNGNANKCCHVSL